MYPILAVLVATSPVYFEAKVATFGCNSTQYVTQLQKLRSDNTEFQKFLYQQVFLGQCVPINKGSVVQGAVESDDSSVLRVNGEIDPPGYMSPVTDFEAKPDFKYQPKDQTP